MGAFFLYKNQTDIDLDSVRSVFDKKGFCAPAVFVLNGMTLWLYRKQLVVDENYVMNATNSSLFATGTVVYKGLSYRDTLQALLDDYLQNQLDLNELIGSFCLIFYVRGKIRILTDRLCVHHIFMDEQQTRLSSSFLVLLSSFKYSQSLNRMAFYEKICTGYIVGPDTLVESIHQITPQSQKDIQDDKFGFITYSPEHIPMVCSDGFDACLEQQLAGLRKYFAKIKPLCNEFSTDLGLSGGYDSRLLFLLCRDADLSLSVYSHLTEGAHEREFRIARQIAESGNLHLQAIKTRRVSDHDENEIVRILSDNMFYFDGRNARTVGTFSEVSTRTYKTRVLGENRTSLNGKAGEIYRNFSFTARNRISLKWWMRNHVYFNLTGSRNWIKGSRPELDKFILSKIESRLNVDLSATTDLLTMRRFYGDILQPDCEGNANNAHNQLSFHLTPFLEYSSIHKSYEASDYIGLTGELESKMLLKLDARIAQLDSIYGFPLSKEPFSHKLYGLIKGFLPDIFWVYKHDYSLRYSGSGKQSLEDYLALNKRSKFIQEIENALRLFGPEVDWHFLMYDGDFRSNAIFIGTFLRQFESKLKI
jgi:hypothetical protein